MIYMKILLEIAYKRYFDTTDYDKEFSTCISLKYDFAQEHQ